MVIKVTPPGEECCVLIILPPLKILQKEINYCVSSWLYSGNECSSPISKPHRIYLYQFLTKKQKKARQHSTATDRIIWMILWGFFPGASAWTFQFPGLIYGVPKKEAAVLRPILNASFKQVEMSCECPTHNYFTSHMEAMLSEISYLV